MNRQSHLDDDDRDDIKKVCFKPLTSGKSMSRVKLNMSYLEDVEVTIVVELGRTVLKAKEILGLEVGSIIEVEKPAGDSVDVYVNNKRFGKGEVIVVNDVFCLKIGGILPPNACPGYATSG